MKKMSQVFALVLFIALGLLAGIPNNASAFGNPFYTAEDQKLFMAGLMKNAPGDLDPKGEWKPVKTGSVDMFYRGEIKDFTGKVGVARCYTGGIPIIIASQKKSETYEYMYYFSVVIVQKTTENEGKPLLAQFIYGGKWYVKNKNYKMEYKKSRDYLENEMKTFVEKGDYKF